MRRGIAIAAAVLLTLLAAPVAAQEASSFSLDVFQGPIVSSGRVVGMGGAFVSVAEGADGHIVNPAAFTTRYPYAADDWFDWDWALSWLTVGLQDETALDLSGQQGAYEAATFAQGGLNLKFGRHGLGIHIVSQNYRVVTTHPETGEAIEVEFRLTQGGLGYAYPFLDGDLTVGVLFNTGEAGFFSGEEQLIGISGEGLLWGVLWAPCAEPFRVGGTLRTQILGRERVGTQATIFGDMVPASIVVPSQLSVGASYMTGPRRYNVCPSFGDWEEVSELPPSRTFRREYLLLSADLVLTGATEEGIGVQSFLQQRVQRSGQSASASIRLGGESEVWSDLLVVRAGTYYEPSRFEERLGRFHATFGFDVHLFELVWDWKASFVADLAPDYTNVGLGVGLWH